MKITDVKLRFAKHYLFVQVYTDAGITGLGEAGNWGYLQATAAAIEKFADYLIGKDPFRIEDFNQNFLRSVYFRGSVIMSAISAIDIALWDIKGKALGVPVYELLGGKTRDKVRVYASVMHITDDKEELAKPYDILTKEIAKKVVSIQINDAYERPYAAPVLRDESMHDRLAPGTGAKDTAGFVRMVREAGVSPLAVGVEVISDAILAKGVEKAAAYTYENTVKVLKEAWPELLNGEK